MTKYREILRLKNQGSYSTLASQDDMDLVVTIEITTKMI